MPPNVLFITSHDTGRHLHCYGVEAVRSPNLDRLAAQGCLFTRYFATAALCSPSRGAMMTGRYPQSNGMLGLCHGLHAWSLNEGERHLSHLLHDAGYYTALLGHQHESMDVDAQLCFDEHGLKWEDESRGLHTSCETVADAVNEFLHGRAAAETPFYLQVGFFETHRPLDFGGSTPDAHNGVSVPPYIADDETSRNQFARFQGHVHRMDASIGRIMASLHESGLADDTLVIYTTDHGIPFPRAKTTLYDPGIGVALLMCLQGTIDAGTTCDWLLSNVDLVPTILSLAGAAVPDSVEGVSFHRAFTGGQPVRSEVYAEHHGLGGEDRCVRTDRYKLIRHFALRPMPVPPVRLDTEGLDRHKYSGYAELYDLKQDPLETRNLIADPGHAAERASLEKLLWRWMKDTGDPALHGPVCTPFYCNATHDFRSQGPEG
jgi:arylsulfatase A-like enzyme